MATNLDIIKRAMKKIHVLASGSNPTSAQAADGMSALQSLIVELIGQGSLGRLNDVLATSNYTAYEYDRVLKSVGVTVTLPTTITSERCDDVPPYYGYSGSTYPRPPYDRAPIVEVSSTGVSIYHVWCAYKNAWVTINSLTQQGSFPFADYLEDGFAAMLAERIADDFDQEVGIQTAKQAGNCRLLLSTKFDSAARPAQAEYS